MAIRPLTDTGLPPGAAYWAAQAIGRSAAVENVRRLAGSTSTTLYALDIAQGRNMIPCVLRLYDNAVWMAKEPDVPQHEATALQRVAEAGLTAPKLLGCDPDGSEAGGIPLLLMTRLPGRVVLVPDDLDRWLHELAAALLTVHAVSAEGLPWRYRPYADLPTLRPPVWSRIPRFWEQAIALAQEAPPPAPECFIHRDYHPNNVLWQNGQISGLVDWPNACRGVANVDVSWCRHNLIYLHGIPAADLFLQAYERLTGASFAYHPYWDLLALMEALPGPPRLYPPWAEFGIRHLTEEMMRERVDAFLESVLRRL